MLPGYLEVAQGASGVVDWLALNSRVLGRLMCEKYLHVVEGAGPLFEGSGELEEVAGVAAGWFETHPVGG